MRSSLLRQIFEGAPDNLKCLERREEIIPDPRNETVLHFRSEDEFFVLVNAGEFPSFNCHQAFHEKYAVFRYN